jgi:casein kinase II subunit beta
VNCLSADLLNFEQVEKYKKGDFGKCPRVACGTSHLLPTGLSDNPNVNTVKLFCPKCEDLYNPKSSRHASIDGAYFGTSFQNILFQVYPALVPEKSVARYEPKVFGFKLHAAAALQRWQDARREEMVNRLKSVGIDGIFAEEDDLEEEEMEEDGGEL